MAKITASQPSFIQSVKNQVVAEIKNPGNKKIGFHSGLFALAVYLLSQHGEFFSI